MRKDPVIITVKYTYGNNSGTFEVKSTESPVNVKTHLHDIATEIENELSFIDRTIDKLLDRKGRLNEVMIEKSKYA